MEEGKFIFIVFCWSRSARWNAAFSKKDIEVGYAIEWPGGGLRHRHMSCVFH